MGRLIRSNVLGKSNVEPRLVYMNVPNSIVSYNTPMHTVPWQFANSTWNTYPSFEKTNRPSLSDAGIHRSIKKTCCLSTLVGSWSTYVLGVCNGSIQVQVDGNSRLLTSSLPRKMFTFRADNIIYPDAIISDKVQGLLEKSTSWLLTCSRLARFHIMLDLDWSHINS